MNVSDLRQLELKNIGSWPTPAKAVAIGLVCLLVLAAGWYVDLQDQTTLLEQAEQKELVLKQDLESKQAKVVNLDALTAQLEDIKQSFGDMLKRLPNKTEVAGLLVDISQQGLGAGLEFELFKPGNEQPADFYVELPIQIRVTGGYHQFGQFVSGVADLPRIVTQHNIQITSNKSGEGGLVMESTAKTYRYLGVLNLVRQVPYDLRVEGSAVVVTLHSGGAMVPDVKSAATTPVAAVPRPASPRPIPARATGPGIEDVDFRRGEAGEGRIIVLLSESGLISNVREEGGQIIIDFPDAALPERLDRRLDVLDFATPVKEVDTFPHEGGARMVITPSGHYEHLAYQSDKVLTVDVKPLTKEEEQALKKEKFGYTGEKLSLNFQDIEVRAVLQLIADFTGLNMVASDTVAGNVTLRLKNVPWDQALEIILKSKGLGMRQAGNVMMVAPQEEIAAREKLELESQKQLAELAPLKTEFIEVNYAKAADVATLLKTEGNEGNKLVSKDGRVSVDQRTNTLLIQETAEKLAEIRKVITTLDVPVRQVLIEPRIVIANQDFSRELGVKFGYSKNSGLSTDNFGVVVGGTQPGDTNFGAGTAFTTDDLENFIVDLPAATPAGAIGLAVGKIGSYLLQLELSALQAEGRGEVVSSPRVITTDQKEAVIEQGTEIPYASQTSSGATDIDFKKAVLSLRVTPHITPDDRINMSIQVNKDAVGQVFEGIPSIDTRNVTTEVLVDNGETVVLGGIYEHSNRNDVRRVPFFGELPYFGTLFRNTLNARNKDELLIFVTPKVMKEGLTLR